MQQTHPDYDRQKMKDLSPQNAYVALHYDEQHIPSNKLQFP